MMKTEFPAFTALLKKGKDYADNLVENSLFKRAMGYEFEETTQEVRMGKEGEATPSIIRKVKKHVIPDTLAQIFWLKNRRPESWRDKQVVEHENNEFMQALKELGREEGLNADAVK